MRRRMFTASLGAAVVAVGALPVPAVARPGRQSKDAYIWRNAVVNGGGFVPSIIFNETEPDLIYARTDVGGCYRWQEDSRTWRQPVDWVGRDNWGYYYVVPMATDPVETNRVYAAVGAYTIDWDPNNGAVLYFDDYGETWGVAELPFKQGGNMPGRGMGERLAVNPADNAEVYLGTPGGNGPWRSTHYGRTQAAVENFPNQDPVRPRHPVNPVRLLRRHVLPQHRRGCDVHRHRSDRPAPEGVDDFRVVPGRKGHIWLAGRSDKAEVATGLWRSKDGGATWKRISAIDLAIDLAIGVGFGEAATRSG